MNHEQELKKVIDRLRASDTRIKRRNARRTLFKLLARIKRELSEEFPVIDKRGEPRSAPKHYQCRCPVCKIPLRDHLALGTHLAIHHKRGRGLAGPRPMVECWCGVTFRHTATQRTAVYKPRANGQRKYDREVNRNYLLAFGRHIARVKDPRAHVAINVLKNSKVRVH